MIAVFRGNGERHLTQKSIPHSDYLFRTVTHWRLRAEAMRTLAEEANDSTVRAMMLRIAADYDRLAAAAGRSRFRRSSRGGIRGRLACRRVSWRPPFMFEFGVRVMSRVIKRSASQAVKVGPSRRGVPSRSSFLRSFPCRLRSLRRGRNGCTKSNLMAIEWPRGLTMAV
jgi:hypothetical protein